MDQQINLQPVKTDFHVDKEDKYVECDKTIKLNIFGEVKYFSAQGFSDCAQGNTFNESFGKALAWIRASQDIGRQVEVSLIKYTFDHFLDKKETDLQLDNKLHALMKQLAKVEFLIKEQNEKRPETINIYDADGSILNTINLTTKADTKGNNNK